MPREDVTVMESPASSAETIKNKVVELTKSLRETEERKKAANADFNAIIKDLKEEIKMSLELLKGMENG